MKEYFYAKNGEQFGPFTIDELRAEKITKDTLVWKEGLTDWQKAEMLEEINRFFASTPPPLQNQYSFVPPLPKSSSKFNISSSRNNFSLFLKISLTIILIGIISFAIISLVNKNSSNNSNNLEYSAYSVPPARELTAEELQAELKRKELKLPLNYLTVEYNVRTNLLGTDIIEGTIYNSASMATFKDVTLLISFETASNTTLGSKDEVIYDYIQPGGKKYFKIKLNSPAYTKYIGATIKKAKPAKDM